MAVCERSDITNVPKRFSRKNSKKRLKYLDYLILIASRSHMQSWSAMNLKLTALMPVCDLDDGDDDDDLVMVMVMVIMTMCELKRSDSTKACSDNFILL